MAATMDSAEDAARAAQNSAPVEALARLGLAARGLVWLVLSGLALSLVAGRTADADHDGALRALRDTPIGKPLLVTLAVGFLGYGTWCLLCGAVGHRDETGIKRLRHRIASLAKGIMYLGLCAWTTAFLIRGGGGSGDAARSRTAEVMQVTGGRTLVGLIGAAVVLTGLVMGARAVLRRHALTLENYRIPTWLRRPGIAVGTVGHIGRGFVVALVGAFLVRAAVHFDPQEAKGLDAALQAVVEQPYGRGALAVSAVGMLAFALWSFFEAAFRDI